MTSDPALLLHASCSAPNFASSIFGGLLQPPCPSLWWSYWLVASIPWPLLLLRDDPRISTCRQPFPCLSSLDSSSTLYYLRNFICTSTVLAEKKITADKPSAHTRANGYKCGARRDIDGLQDRNKHVDKAKNN